MSYHNTNRLTGPDLRGAGRQAATQEDRVLRYFEVMGEASPSKVAMHCFGGNVPITSVRRAITNLTVRCLLVKTEQTVPGKYGKPEHVWRLAEKPGQQSLFAA